MNTQCMPLCSITPDRPNDTKQTYMTCHVTSSLKVAIDASTFQRSDGENRTK